MAPFFSVVIPTHNRRSLLDACLRSLDQQTLAPSDFEVVVVDDASDDGTDYLLSTRSSRYRLRHIRLSRGGPGAARNAGVAIARGIVIAFTEDDVVVAPDWLERAKKRFEADDRISIVDGWTSYPGRNSSVRQFEDDNAGLPAFIPCNLFIRRKAFHAVGGFDEAFWDPQTKLYFREDSDLGFRLLSAGYRVQVAPDVVVEHPQQFTSLRDCFRHARRYVMDPLLYKKHPRHFRRMIEAKSLLGVHVWRPLHYVALIYAIALLLVITAVLLRNWGLVALSSVLALGLMTIFRYRYQKLRAFHLHRLDQLFPFAVLPLVYLASVVQGCVRHRSFRLLV
ncbi:MAG: glycosyltransferase [Actinomycetota bacterium]|nr:glycosyltransferase [Actinomycetota bacterium]